MNDEIIEKFFSHPEIQKIPVGYQSTAIRAFQEVIEDILEVNPYATLSELSISGHESISAEF